MDLLAISQYFFKKYLSALYAFCYSIPIIRSSSVLRTLRTFQSTPKTIFSNLLDADRGRSPRWLQLFRSTRAGAERPRRLRLYPLPPSSSSVTSFPRSFSSITSLSDHLPFLQHIQLFAKRNPGAASVMYAREPNCFIPIAMGSMKVRVWCSKRGGGVILWVRCKIKN